MKLIKINTDHYVVVDDSPIKEGDWTHHHVKGVYRAKVDGAYTNQKKITHSTQPLEQVNFVDEAEGIITLKIKPLSLSDVKELIGEVDVDKKAQEYLGTFGTDREYQGFKHGYNQCLEDNKEKKYTEEDIRKAYDEGYSVRDAHGDRSDNMTSDEYVKSLQPKTEWEVEWVDGKLKLVQ